MSNLETKAIFYAYSNNALDHLAPYAVLCKKKKMSCTVIFGEDFVRQKVRPKRDIVQIFKDHKINTHNITSVGKKGITLTIFNNILRLANLIENYKFIPNYFKTRIRGLLNRFYEGLNGELIGKNAAIKLLSNINTNKFVVFVDHWQIKKKIQNSFLSFVKGKATIISTGHSVWHVHQPSDIDPSSCEDIALTSNRWEFDVKSIVKNREITGCLRFSKKWLETIDNYSKEKKVKVNQKKNVLVLGHNELYTSDWKRMIEFLNNLAERKDLNLRILPHVRGMSNMAPSKILEKVWDSKSTLNDAVKKSDIVLFWESSGIFEAVVRNKKVFFLSFLSARNGKFLWQKNAPENIIIKNENELFNALDNYDENGVIDNLCFEKIICPDGPDPWNNVSNFLDKFINSDLKN